MRRRKRPLTRYSPKPEINITPFVDVMLVLLLVFMITAPLLSVGVEVDLPDSRAKPLPAITDPVIVTIQESGEIFLKEAPIKDLTTLISILSDMQKKQPELQVLLRAYRGLQYGEVVKVMGDLTDAGVKRITLLTRSDSGG